MEGTEMLEKGLADIKSQVETKGNESNAAIEKIKGDFTQLETKYNELKEKGATSEDLGAMQKHLDALDIRMKGQSAIETESKSFGSVLEKAMEGATDDLAKFQRKEIKSFSLDLKAVGDMGTGNVTGGNRYGQVMDANIRMVPSRKVHMSDILPGGTVGPGNSFTFMRENGIGEGDIAPAAENSNKSQFDQDLIESTVQIETIAGILRISKKMLNNVPGMLSYLQARLPERFQRVLDNQILYGSGTTPNLKGILTAGNFVTSTALAPDKLIEKVIKDIAILEDTYERDANGIVLRPRDYYSFFLNKASGSGEYDLPQGVTFVNGQMSILGIPVYATTALTGTDYVVGDWNMGAQLLTQEGMRIEFFEQDANNVTQNKVTVRIEGNYALPVYSNDSFIKGSTVVGV